VIGQDGTVYVGVNTNLWAISPSGQKKWEQLYGSELIETAPLALADGSVCCVSRQGQLINLNFPGQFNWTYEQNWCGTLSPAVSTDGTIYTTGHVLGTGTVFYALRAEVALAQSSWPKLRRNARNTGTVVEGSTSNRSGVSLNP
jgi:outer membrane protein assembly factor BamB